MLKAEWNEILLVAQHSPTASHVYITYIDYLVNTWMPEPLWQSWSHKGRIITSTILKIPIEGVLPTTNHLEAFNGLLKHKYIPWWQRSGSRLCFDFLIHILITKILPDIFASRLSHQNYLHWVAECFSDHTGGVNLVEIKKLEAENTVKRQVMCWWEPDKQRDADSRLLLKHGHLHSVHQTVSDCQYEATCLSAQMKPTGVPRLQYELILHRSGHGSCTCQDFSNRGGACKHLRALRLLVDNWAARQLIHPFHYPSSQSAASQLVSPTSQPGSKSAEIPPSSNNSIPSMLTNILALRQLSGKNIQSESTDQDGLSTEGETDLEISEENDILVRITFVCDHCESKLLTTFKCQCHGNMALTSSSNPTNAVTIQVQQRVDHMIKSLLPRLHGLSILTTESTLLQTQDIIEFQDTIQTISNNLDIALQGCDTTLLVTKSKSNIIIPFTSEDGKRKHHTVLQLLPASPEVRQRRKTSHSTM